MLEERDGVQFIDDIKSEYIAADKVKLAAKIKFDLQELTQSVLTEMEIDIQEFAKDPLERAELRKLFEKSIGYMLTYTTTIVQDLEDDLKEAFPYVSEIDLEQSLDNIHKDFPLRRNKK